jgi:hypothetical protein
VLETLKLSLRWDSSLGEDCRGWRRILDYEIHLDWHWTADTIVIEQLSLWERKNARVKIKSWRIRRPSSSLEHSVFWLSSKPLAESVFESLKDGATQ